MGDFWKPDQLPMNKKLLGETIRNLISEIGIDTRSLRELLTMYFESDKKFINALSPYGVIVHALLMFRRDEMLRLLQKADSSIKILCYPEIEESLLQESREKLRNVISL